MPPRDEGTLRVLVVDDSAYNRKTITHMLESLKGVEVIGRAFDGKQALKLACELHPDLITLDLEMPEMDGFAFLRLLMSRQPTPVLVISGYSARENVFRALELGALDFIATPGHSIMPDLRKIRQDLAEKIAMVRRLQKVSGLIRRATDIRNAAVDAKHAFPDRTPLQGDAPRAIIGIASSTGGPPAIQELLLSLPKDLPAALVIAQHMPAQFTATFAERLDGMVGFRVVEAQNGHGLYAGVVYITPGATNLSVAGFGQNGFGELRVEPVVRDVGGVSIAPSADHLFAQFARRFGPRFCAVVLTGMGSDGTLGAAEVRKTGGLVFAEDPDSAVMPGMPRSVVESGIVDGVFSLERLHEAIETFVFGLAKAS